MRTEAEQKIYEYKKAWAKANAEKVRASRKKYEENNKELVGVKNIELILEKHSPNTGND